MGLPLLHEENSRRVYKRKIIGTVIEFPKRKYAERELIKLRANLNDGAAFAPMTVEQLGVHFMNHEVPLKAFSTQEGYKNIIKTYVVQRWGKESLSTITLWASLGGYRFSNATVRVTHAIFRNVEGETKTAGSHKPVPLPPIVIEELSIWRMASL